MAENDPSVEQNKVACDEYGMPKRDWRPITTRMTHDFTSRVKFKVENLRGGSTVEDFKVGSDIKPGGYRVYICKDAWHLDPMSDGFPTITIEVDSDKIQKLKSKLNEWFPKKENDNIN